MDEYGAPRTLLLTLFGLLLLLLLPPLTHALLRRSKRLEPNFRGEIIPQSYGVMILFWTAPMLAGIALLYPATGPVCLRWLVTVVGFGALGWIDDTWGTKKIKGLRGHFRAAFRDHTLTTGFCKAVGGALLALDLGWSLHPGHVASALVAAALIALAANAINLLDLRPGRAGAVFLAAGTLVTVCAFFLGSLASGLPFLILVLLPTLPVWSRDARARVMMGDTGSNLLGASLGLGLAELPGWEIQALALAGLLGLHILAERISLTALIERTPTLRALDRLTGVR